MLSISEFHFAFCGIATVAATLGYACARRAAFSFASSADVEVGPPEERSLKRKLDHSDEHDPDPEQLSRPMKRNRTPPSEKLDLDEDLNQEWEVIVAPPTYEKATELRHPEESGHRNVTPSSVTIERAVTPAREPTPPAHPLSDTSSQPNEKGAEAVRCSTPQPPQINISPNEPETPPARPVTPPKPVVTPKIKPANAFSTFSGSHSPFASYSNPSGTSPFTLSGQTVKAIPAWKRDNDDVFGQTSSADALAPSPNDPLSSVTAKFPVLSDTRTSNDPQGIVKTSNHLTGEENETVEAELKGVKLFTKRGHKEFTDGMYGHIKILALKPSPQNVNNGDPQGTEGAPCSRARLLFRRDPLGQVSMNVGLYPTVRCHFDSAENILRVILMEQVWTDEKNSKEDIVIYALKPGRAGKGDFRSFAKALCDHEELQSREVTHLAAPGDAAAAAP